MVVSNPTLGLKCRTLFYMKNILLFVNCGNFKTLTVTHIKASDLSFTNCYRLNMLAVLTTVTNTTTKAAKQVKLFYSN